MGTSAGATGTFAGAPGNVSGWASDFTKTYTLSGNGTLTFSFYTTNVTTEAWKGWTMFVSNSPSDAWNTWMVCRGGGIIGEGWGSPTGEGTRTFTDTYASVGNSQSIIEAMNGATVNMAITRNSTAITAVATVSPTNGDNEFTETFTYTYSGSDDATANLYISFSIDEGYVSINNATFKAAEATTSTATLSCASSMTVVGNSYYSEGDGNGANYASTIWLNSYANQGGAGAMSFVLDDNWDAAKVSSAKLRIYPISKCDKSGRSGDIYIRALDAYPSLALTTTAYNTNHSVYQESSTTSKRYTFGSATILSTISGNGANTGTPAINAYYDIDLTDYIRGLSKSAGNSVYFGIDISDWAACMSIGAYHNANAPELVITYNDNTVYDYVVNAKDGSGNLLKELASGMFVEGSAAVTVAYPQYVLSGTTLYNIANNGSGDWFRTSITPDANNFEKVLTYNGTAVENVVYYSEAENITGWARCSSDFTSRASNGYCARFNSYTKLLSLEPGKYKVYVRAINGATKAGGSVSIKIGDDETTIIDAIPSGTNNLANSDELNVTSTSDIKLLCNGADNKGLDWVYIVRTGDATVPVPVGATGFATYSNANVALDFTGLGVKAYKATLTGENTVLLSPVTTVPANTGLFLKGAPDTYNVPVITSASAVEGNLLKPSADADIPASVDGTNHYVLANGTNGVGFYNLDAAKNIGAGKAYLETTTALATGSTARVSIVFEDEETTGISATLNDNVGMENDKAFYNLQGQRVAQPRKGLYIMNGKKVIEK